MPRCTVCSASFTTLRPRDSRNSWWLLSMVQHECWTRRKAVVVWGCRSALTHGLLCTKSGTRLTCFTSAHIPWPCGLSHVPHSTPRRGRVFLSGYQHSLGACTRVAGWGTMLQARRSRVRFPMRSLHFFSLQNLFSCNMALGFTQPLTEMSTRWHGQNTAGS
jgi:hypothetical protein